MNNLISRAHLRVTKTRLALLDVLEKNEKPLQASEIIKALHTHKESFDEATVYRILDIFYERGILKKIYTPRFPQARYELNTTDHHHFTCDKCGAVEDINSCNVEELIKDLSVTKHLKVLGHILEFNGLCAQCQN